MFWSRKRRVRLHFKDDSPSIEGIQEGRRTIGGHYVIGKPKLWRSKDQSVALSGHVEIPVESVYFVQVNP